MISLATLIILLNWEASTARHDIAERANGTEPFQSPANRCYWTGEQFGSVKGQIGDVIGTAEVMVATVLN